MKTVKLFYYIINNYILVHIVKHFIYKEEIQMKKSAILFSMVVLGLGLSGCGNSHHDESAASSSVKTSQVSHHHRRAQRQASDQSASSASQSSERQSSSASASSEQHVINTADDAASLVAHAMAADDSLYHAVPVSGGFEVTRSDMDQKAFVHYDGSVTWDDGTTQPYSEVSAPENNDRVNSTFAPSGN